LDFEINEDDPNFRVRFTVEALPGRTQIG